MAAEYIDALLALQAIDMKIRDFKSRLELLPTEMKRLVERRTELENGIAAADNAVRKLELEIKSQESAIENLNAEISKLRQQSAIVRKNNEYQAMLAAVESNQKQIGAAEERVIELLDELEAAKKRARTVRSENEAAGRDIRSELEELVSFGGRIREELKRLEASRPGAIRGISSVLLNRYTTLLGGRNAGAPVVKVENGSCGHCHMRVTAQTLSELRKNGTGVCDTCQHIIYNPEE